jgi:hypothetical protein
MDVSTPTFTATTRVILNSPADWDEWNFLVREKAQSLSIWEYINPNLPQEPVVLLRLTPPELLNEETMPVYKELRV